MGLYLESYKVIPKRNYLEAYGWLSFRVYNGVSGKASTHRILDGVRNLESYRSLRKYIVTSFLSSSFIDLLRQKFPKSRILDAGFRGLHCQDVLGLGGGVLQEAVKTPFYCRGFQRLGARVLSEVE